MIDFASKLHAGKLRIGTASVIGLISAGTANADIWDVFEARCLVPFEHQSFADIAELKPVPVEEDVKRFALTDADGTQLVLELENEPDDGLRSCLVSGPSSDSLGAFEAWMAEMLAGERYVEVEDNIWHSQFWIEPVLEIKRFEREGEVVLRILETELET